MRQAFLLYSLFFVLTGFGQGEKVDLAQFNSAKLNEYLIAYTNQLRERKRKQSLDYYPALDAAAKNHATYMAEHNYLGHTQKNKTYKTVKDRVSVLGGNAEFVGENVQYISINYELQKAKQGLTYQQLAKILGENWKNSRGHYLNIITPEYTGVSHQFVVADGKLFACQVLSSKPFEPTFEYLKGPNFKVKNKSRSYHCKRTDKKYRSAQIHYGWYRVSNDSIFYYNAKRTFFVRYEIPFVKRTISIPGTEHIPRNIFKRKGKLSVDFIHISQFDCEGNEMYDGALNYDGYYLGYIDRKAVRKANISTSRSMIKLYVGQIPKVEDENYQVDFFLTKNDRPCSRQSLIFANPDHLKPEEYFQLSHPKITVGELNYVHDSIVAKVSFDRGEVAADQSAFYELRQTLAALKENSVLVSKLTYTGVASIEGSAQINKALIAQRQMVLKSILENYYSQVPIQYQLIENFEDFKIEMSKTQGERWLSATNEDLRAYANKHKNKPKIAAILDQTRQSEITIYYEKPYSKVQLDATIQNLKQLISESEYVAALLVWQQLAKKALDGDEQIAENLLAINIPEKLNFSQMLWEQFVLDIKLNHTPVTAQKLNALKALGAIPNNLQYLEYRLLFNLFNESEECHIDDFDAIYEQVTSKKSQKWLMALYLIHDYEFGHRMRFKGSEIARLAASGRFNMYQTYFVCQYLIAYGNLNYAKALLERYAKKSNGFPKLYQQYLKLSYYFYQFENEQQFKTDIKVLKNLAKSDNTAFCNFFKWYHIGVRCLEKDEVSALYCSNCI